MAILVLTCLNCKTWLVESALRGGVRVLSQTPPSSLSYVISVFQRLLSRKSVKQESSSLLWSCLNKIYLYYEHLNERCYIFSDLNLWVKFHLVASSCNCNCCKIISFERFFLLNFFSYLFGWKNKDRHVTKMGIQTSMYSTQIFFFKISTKLEDNY